MPKNKGQAPEGYREGLDAMAHVFEPWFKAWARGNLELLALASRRTRAYLELPDRLQRCRSPQDLAHESICFWQGLIEDYTESSQRLATGWSAIMQRSQREPGAQPERDYITFPEPGQSDQAADERQAPRRAA